MEIVLATANPHKIREFKEIFKCFPRLSHIDLLSFHQFPDYSPPGETGETFQENAILKACHAAAALNHWVLADDSGLVVPTLHGAPGVKSRRFAGPQATDSENRQKLLREMAHLEDLQRSAYFECCLVIANPEGVQKCVTGTCEGAILKQEKGRNGFGYDSLFIKNDYEKTFAELDEFSKNRVSHRRKAFERLALFLENLKN